MVTEVKMPKLGDTMEEGVLTKWRKKEGEKVEKGEILFEVMTDKANFEVESPAAGFILKTLAKEEETVPVIKVVGYIADSMDEKIPAPTAQPVSAASVPTITKSAAPSQPSLRPAQADDAARIMASPVAKRLAAEKGIDLSTIKGSGPGGRIEKEDVLNVSGKGTGAKAQPAAMEVNIPAGAKFIQVKGVRKIIAERMTLSKQTVPHFYLTAEADMTIAYEIREKLKKEKVHFSLNDLIIKAAAQALSEFPVVNGFFAEDKIVFNSNINTGIAVTRPAKLKCSTGEEMDVGELVVPVLKDADKKNLLQIASESKELIAKARENRLNLDELEGGTITLSSLGTMGIDVFNAIVNPPQATLLAIGEIKKRPYVVGDKIEIRSIVNLSLSCDHRIVDGALGAQFLKKIKELLEKPEPFMPK